MKIVINYDLADKIAEAKKGYSLKRCIKRTLGMAAISSVVGIPNNLIEGNITPELWIELASYLTIHSGYTAMLSYAFNGMTKESAQRKLNELIYEFNNSYIRTDEETILDTHKYKSEYDVKFNSFFPMIEQKKYFFVPVRDEFYGDKEITLVQEHVVGSRDYILSLGEPSEQKVYSFGAQKQI